MKKLISAVLLIMLLGSSLFAFDGWLVVTNDTGYDIWYVYVSHTSDNSWGEDRLGSEILFDGDSFRIDLEGYPDSFFDIRAIDEDDDEYFVWNLDVSRFDVDLTLADLNTPRPASGDFEGWVEVTNDTGFDIWYLYVSHQSESTFGDDVLGANILYDGDTFRVDLEGYPDSFFDIRGVDVDGDSYTRYGVDVFYEDVTFTLKDLD